MCKQNKKRQKRTFWNEVLSQFVSNDSKVLKELGHKEIEEKGKLVYLKMSNVTV